MGDLKLSLRMRANGVFPALLTCPWCMFCDLPIKQVEKTHFTQLGSWKLGQKPQCSSIIILVSYRDNKLGAKTPDWISSSFYPLHAQWCCSSLLMSISNSHKAKAGNKPLTGDQSINSFTSRDSFGFLTDLTECFLEEIRVPRGGPSTHEENMQTTCKLQLGTSPEPSYREAPIHNLLASSTAPNP